MFEILVEKMNKKKNITLKLNAQYVENNIEPFIDEKTGMNNRPDVIREWGREYVERHGFPKKEGDRE